MKNSIEVDLEKKVIDSKQKKHDLKMQVSQVEYSWIHCWDRGDKRSIEGRTKRRITMPHMCSSIKKAKYKDGNLGAYHFKPSHHCRACMQ